jgi:hypothetical protein
MKDMLIDEAWKVLQQAKAGNSVSATVYNLWAETKKMPPLENSEYDTVLTYDDFYNVCYYYMFGD